MFYFYFHIFIQRSCFMSRLARKDLQTQFLHVMVQGINKEFIFNKHDYIQTYLKTINQYEKEFPITIIAYCIMNNHAHLLIHVEEIKFLSKFMHIVNLLYSQFYNKENNRCGVIFRNKYKIEPIYDLSHLINCINYIHLNPVKANIVDNCSKYPYSSNREQKTKWLPNWRRTSAEGSCSKRPKTALPLPDIAA